MQGYQRGRDPVKRGEIIAYIRQRIVSGEWRPGDRLPSRSWFEAHFAAATHTVQTAFDRLQEQRFLIAVRRLGTRVHPAPPHLTRYAVLLSGLPSQGTRSSRALAAAAQLLQKEGLDIQLHFDLDRPAEHEAHRKLYAEFADHVYAGVFFESPPPAAHCRELELLRELPLTGLLGDALPEAPNVIPCRWRAAPRTLERESSMIRHLAASGVRRVALLRLHPGHDGMREQECRRRLEEENLGCPPGYYLEFHPHAVSQCCNVLRILMAPGNPLRPDGLAVLDDRLLGFVEEVLTELYGDRAAQEVFVASWGYAPALPATELKVRFFGIDLVHTLREGLRAIAEYRGGHTPAPPQIVRIEEADRYVKNEYFQP